MGTPAGMGGDHVERELLRFRTIQGFPRFDPFRNRGDVIAVLGSRPVGGLRQGGGKDFDFAGRGVPSHAFFDVVLEGDMGAGKFEFVNAALFELFPWHGHALVVHDFVDPPFA